MSNKLILKKEEERRALSEQILKLREEEQSQKELHYNNIDKCFTSEKNFSASKLPIFRSLFKIKDVILLEEKMHYRVHTTSFTKNIHGYSVISTTEMVPAVKFLAQYRDNMIKHADYRRMLLILSTRLQDVFSEIDNAVEQLLLKEKKEKENLR